MRYGSSVKLLLLMILCCALIGGHDALAHDEKEKQMAEAYVLPAGAGPAVLGPGGDLYSYLVTWQRLWENPHLWLLKIPTFGGN